MFEIFEKNFILITFSFFTVIVPEINAVHRRGHFVSKQKPAIVAGKAHAGISVKKETPVDLQKTDLPEAELKLKKIDSISQMKEVFDNPSQFGNAEKDVLINELIEESKSLDKLSEEMKVQLFLFKTNWANIPQQSRLEVADKIKNIFKQLKLQKKQNVVAERESLVLGNRMLLGTNALGVVIGALNAFRLTKEFMADGFSRKNDLSKFSFATRSLAAGVQAIPAFYNLCKSISVEAAGNKKAVVQKQGLALSGISAVSGLLSGGCDIAGGVVNENSAGKLSRTTSTLFGALQVGSSIKTLANLALDSSIANKKRKS